LEDTLLTFADNPEIREFAPLAFYRLNTPRSIAALAELLTKAKPGTFEHMKSADYLAEIGDQQWFPLLRDVAQQNPGISSYVDDAAELGGDKMLPTLISSDEQP
jgi:HEAT repeat protein